MELATIDIQQQRTEERQAEALKIAAPRAKHVADLRSKAAEIAAEADAAEAKAVQGYAALESLLERRVAVLSDVAMVQRLAADVEGSKKAARAAAIQFIRAQDLVGKQSVLLALDSLARLMVLAPVVPKMLEEFSDAAAELDKQIQAVAREHGIDLRAACKECAGNAAKENPPGRYTRLMAGFTGLIK
jgi:hypothetical protein